MVGHANLAAGAALAHEPQHRQHASALLKPGSAAEMFQHQANRLLSQAASFSSPVLCAVGLSQRGAGDRYVRASRPYTLSLDCVMT